MEVPTSETQLRTQINNALDEVSRVLGNTRNVCRKYYVHPSILDAFMSGALHRIQARAVQRLDASERLVMALLRGSARTVRLAA